MSRPLFDSEYLYGVHDRGAEAIMRQKDVRGWVLVTEQVDGGARSYRDLSDEGFGVMVRLNHGYLGAGTLPRRAGYADFARRCADFVQRSTGAAIWIIGNEPNHQSEWPGGSFNLAEAMRQAEIITPQNYAECFRLVRQAIHALPGHERDLVLPAAVAPWNPALGDWVKYFKDMLAAIGPGNLDGITLHTYTHGHQKALVTSDALCPSPGFTHLRWEFRTYRDFMQAIPPEMRQLPVFITEANPQRLSEQGPAWEDRDDGWVDAAYQEIDLWNREQQQPIRSLILFRWLFEQGQPWDISSRNRVLDDFRRALDRRLTWVREQSNGAWAERVRQLGALEAEARMLLDSLPPISPIVAALTAGQPQIDGLLQQGRSVAGWQTELERIRKVLDTVDVPQPDLRRQLAAAEAEIERLRAELARLTGGSGRLDPPALVDVVDALPKKADAAPFPRQDQAAITRMVISHSGSDKSVLPERIALAYIRNGWWGIGYHFVITPDGTIYQTQRLTTALNPLFNKLNLATVEVCLVGHFMRLKNNIEQPRQDQLPTAAQLAAAGRLLAWLRQELPQTDDQSIVGRKELQPHAGPGEEWNTGANWKQALLQQVEAARATASLPRKPITHYLLFWDHGGDAWAKADWRNAQAYIERFRPTTGFSVADAMQSEHVTIVGGYGGVAQAEGERLKAAGVILHRLAGADEAGTRAMLDQLVAAGVRWPEEVAAGLGATPAPDLELGPERPAEPELIDVPKRPRRRSKTRTP
jgi:hypothetical protein